MELNWLKKLRGLSLHVFGSKRFHRCFGHRTADRKYDMSKAERLLAFHTGIIFSNVIHGNGRAEETLRRVSHALHVQTSLYSLANWRHGLCRFALAGAAARARRCSFPLGCV